MNTLFAGTWDKRSVMCIIHLSQRLCQVKRNYTASTWPPVKKMASKLENAKERYLHNGEIKDKSYTETAFARSKMEQH